MSDASHEVGRLISGLPLFAGLDPAECAALERALQARELRRGDVVCREGDPSEDFFVIERGELEVFEGGVRVRRLAAGDFFGELALLLGTGRTATVRAVRPSRLLALPRREFDRLLLRNPRALWNLSRELGARLAARARADAAVRGAMTVGVIAGEAVPGRSLVAGNLRSLLGAYAARPALWISLEPSDHAPHLATLEKLATESETVVARLLERHARGAEPLRLAASGAGEPERAALGRLLERSERSAPYVVLELGTLETAGAELCDALVRVERECSPPEAREDQSLRVLSVVNRAAPGSVSLPISHCEPFVLPLEPRLAGLDQRARAAFALERPRAPLSIVLQRLARKLLGRTVGVAVGGGAAFGIAQIGVLRVLDDAGVPIDLLAGTSMGSLIALGHALGMTPRELERIALRLGSLRMMLRLLDPTLTRPGLLAGDRLVGMLGPLTGERRQFEDLVRPCRVVATDIESGERVVIGDGSIERAFRASCSVPGVWSPVRVEGRVLVDGGVSDPVPAGVVHEMGADLCIAIHVVGRPRKGARSLVTRLSGAANRANPFAYLARDRSLPNTFDVLWNSMQTLQHELGHFRSAAADLCIEPDLSEFTWTDVHRAPELIRRGAEAAEAALPELARVLRERGLELAGRP